MNMYRKLLRIWIAFTSFISFMIGWAFLAQTSETETFVNPNTGMTGTLVLPPIPSVDGISSQNLETDSVQMFTFNQSTQTQQMFAPSLRTGGS